MSENRPLKPPTECLICGAAVPAKALACQECGADDRTGWNDAETRYDGLDLPAEAFEGESKSMKSENRTIFLFWWVIGIGTAFMIGVLVFID